MGEVVPIKDEEKAEIHPAFAYKGHKIYKSYSFVDKDPVIDELRTVVRRSKMTYTKISEESGVSHSTLWNWFEGPTRRPQSASVEAVFRALGYKRRVVKG